MKWNLIRCGIEYQPENGKLPHVVVISVDDGPRCWFAYATRAEANRKAPYWAMVALKAYGGKIVMVEPKGYE